MCTRVLCRRWIFRCCCREHLRGQRCWKNSATLRTLFYLPRQVSGRASTFPAISFLASSWISLPFAVPSDPIVAARVKTLQEEGRNAFSEYQVPEAVLALKQGFGRLIRARTDRGVLAILDNRIERMQYGKIFMASLPDYSITRDIQEVERFMQPHP